MTSVTKNPKILILGRGTDAKDYEYASQGTLGKADSKMVDDDS